jgi:hypothetical protein
MPAERACRALTDGTYFETRCVTAGFVVYEQLRPAGGSADLCSAQDVI